MSIDVCGMLEREDQDMNALVSSLVQLILDDHCQTIEGFQDLIDREWTVLGHRWVTRYGASSDEKVTSELIQHCNYMASVLLHLDGVM